ncbi:MAG: HlyC/CorC family transporter [Proteobacteria bacterium]|nr:HlyC/CorC family transporter [Pseudomonadota bacterium]
MEVPSSSSLYSIIKKSITGTFGKPEKDKENSDQIDLINNLEDYFNKTIREVMVPRPKMVTIDKSRPIKDAIQLIHDTGHSRIPVQDKKRDNIIGILYAIDLFKYFGTSTDIPVSQVMRKPFFVSYSQQIHLLLSNFKKNRIHLAIVIDEHGGVDGLVTIEDVIEELVGDIPDEFDKDDEPAYETIDNGLVLMDANFPLGDFNDLYGTDFQKEGIETIGGYICHTAGNIPQYGEEFEIEGIDFSVKESNERRLVKLSLIAPKSTSAR